MKTTIEIPDELFRRSKATAALRGESLKEFVTGALEEHLERQPATARAPRGWRSVFGQARSEEVAPIDARIAEEFERIDPDEWR
jgi:hypothetical protein